MLPLFILSLLACMDPEVAMYQEVIKTELGYYKLEMIWLPNPHTVAERASLEVAPLAGGVPLNWFQIEMTPYMPEDSHGLTAPIEMTEKSFSTIANWSYPMEGSWEIAVDVDGPKGLDTAILAIEVL